MPDDGLAGALKNDLNDEDFGSSRIHVDQLAAGFRVQHAQDHRDRASGPAARGRHRVVPDAFRSHGALRRGRPPALQKTVRLPARGTSRAVSKAASCWPRMVSPSAGEMVVTSCAWRPSATLALAPRCAPPAAVRVRRPTATPRQAHPRLARRGLSNVHRPAQPRARRPRQRLSARFDRSCWSRSCVGPGQPCGAPRPERAPCRHGHRRAVASCGQDPRYRLPAF